MNQDLPPDRPSFFENCPDHIHWVVGGVPYGNPMQVISSDFEYRFSTSSELWLHSRHNHLSFRQEVDRAAKKMVERAGNSPIALCVSGGVDSEILARAFRRLDVRFEMFFLSNWGLNENIFSSHVYPLSKELSVPLNVIKIERDYFIEEYAPNCFFQFGCHFPTYLAMTYLFSKIPREFFICVGEGDLEKSGKAYGNLHRRLAEHTILNSDSIPIMLNEIVYRLWARANKREGEFYFYSSTPELIWSMWNHPQFAKRFPFFYTKMAIAAEYPELVHRSKSTNWEIDPMRDRRRTIQSIWSKLADRKDLDFWHKTIGCFASLSS